MITNGDYTIHLFTDTYWNPDMLKAKALEPWGLLQGNVYKQLPHKAEIC